MDTPRNYRLVSVNGVRRPTKTQCQTQGCAVYKQVLAVPQTRAEYQCIIDVAGGHDKPFWTGLVLAGGERLAGTVNGTYYEEIEFWGRAAHTVGVRDEFPDMRWYGGLGERTRSTSVYFHNGYYISAENDLFSRYIPQWPQMFCMCQGKTETTACGLRISSGRLFHLLQITSYVATQYACVLKSFY